MTSRRVALIVATGAATVGCLAGAARASLPVPPSVSWHLLNCHTQTYVGASNYVISACIYNSAQTSDIRGTFFNKTPSSLTNTGYVVGKSGPRACAQTTTSPNSSSTCIMVPPEGPGTYHIQVNLPEDGYEVQLVTQGYSFPD